MKTVIDLADVLTQETPKDRLVVFAWLTLGLVESLKSKTLSAEDAVKVFFHAHNCKFVKNKLRNSTASRVMSHGVQLPDLFDVLQRSEAEVEFQKELETMSSDCRQLVSSKRKAA
jgi:hypothetical protein